jgi:hypothetical protein
MSAVLTPAESSSAKKMNVLGGVLIAAAFVVPFLAIPLGGGTAYSAGQHIARTLGSLLVLALITWAVTHNRGALAKANGRVVTGVLLCLVVASNMHVQYKERGIAKQVMRDAVAFQQTQAAKFTDLDIRFDKVDLTKILTPEAMTAEAGMATARASVAQYRALLAERRALLQTYLSEFERFVASIPPGETKQGAMSSVASGKEQTVQLFNGLDRTQTALIDSIAAILDWGQAQAGHLGVRNGQLLFKTKEQQAELQALLVKLNAAEAEMTKTAQAATAAQAQAQEKLRANMQEAEKLLSK